MLRTHTCHAAERQAGVRADYSKDALQLQFTTWYVLFIQADAQ